MVSSLDDRAIIKRRISLCLVFMKQDTRSCSASPPSLLFFTSWCWWARNRVHSQSSSALRGCAQTHVREIKVCCRTPKFSGSTNNSYGPAACVGAGWECAAYVGGEPVGRCGLVDVVLVVVCVGAALCGLPFAPADGAALHHTAAQLARRLLRGPVRVAVLRHHAESRGGQSLAQRRCTGILKFPKVKGYPLRRRNHQAPSRRPPAQPPWLRVSQEIRFWGESCGVMWPIDWMEIRSDATAVGDHWRQRFNIFNNDFQDLLRVLFSGNMSIFNKDAPVCSETGQWFTYPANPGYWKDCHS